LGTQTLYLLAYPKAAPPSVPPAEGGAVAHLAPRPTSGTTRPATGPSRPPPELLTGTRTSDGGGDTPVGRRPRDASAMSGHAPGLTAQPS